jgi:DNA-binding response OmpR family regulator
VAHILVISANRTRGLFLSHILESAGHTISLSEDATRSTTVSKADVNAVLVDLYLPGAEPLSEVATLRRRLPRVSIIAIASEEHPIDFLELRMTGADDVLRDPLAPDSLLEAVRRAIEDQV